MKKKRIVIEGPKERRVIDILKERLTPEMYEAVIKALAPEMLDEEKKDT